MFFRRHKAFKDKKQAKSIYPYNKPLPFGILGKHNNRAFPTRSVAIQAKMEYEHTSVTMYYVFMAGYKDGELWFPMTECGNIDRFHISLHLPKEGKGHKVDVHGSMKQETTFREDSSPIYFYVCKDGLFGDALVEVGDPIHLTVQYRCKNVLKHNSDHNKVSSVALPLSCCPIPPTSLRVEAEMPETIRKVRCPNRPQTTFAILDETKATVTFPGIEEGGKYPIKIEQYLLVIEVELRD
eukprot:PhF_6_TR40937/c0_g1_i1/m.61935